MAARDPRSVEALMDAGAGHPAPTPIADLYAEAFANFGTAALWSRRPSAVPTITQALVVAEALRNEGDMQAWALAERIETACRAAF